MSSGGQELIRLGALARRLGLSRQWLRDEAEAGRIPHLRVGHVLLFELSTVEQILAERAKTEGRSSEPGSHSEFEGR